MLQQLNDFWLSLWCVDRRCRGIREDGEAHIPIPEPSTGLLFRPRLGKLIFYQSNVIARWTQDTRSRAFRRLAISAAAWCLDATNDCRSALRATRSEEKPVKFDTRSSCCPYSWSTAMSCTFLNRSCASMICNETLASPPLCASKSSVSWFFRTASLFDD